MGAPETLWWPDPDVNSLASATVYVPRASAKHGSICDCLLARLVSLI
jgi:hypothetical protein